MIPHFTRPEWLLAGLPLLIILGLFVLKQSRATPWQAVCDPHLLPWLLTTNTQKSHWLAPIMLGLGWLIAVIALAGPSWQTRPAPLYTDNQANVIAFSLSLAMNNTDLAPTRLERARYKLIDLLKATTSGQVGLIVFSQEAYVVSPLTTDAKTLLALVNDLSPDLMPVQGHDISGALTLANQLLERTQQAGGTITLMSSGPVTEQDIRTAQQLRAKGVRLFILGIGTAQGAPITGADGQYLQDATGAIMISRLDQPELSRLAAAGGGQYFAFTTDERDVGQLIAAITNSQPGKATQAEAPDAVAQWQDQGQWLVIALLPLAALAFRRGWLMPRKAG